MLNATELEKTLNDKNIFPSKKWKTLRKFILQEIDKIDKATTWHPHEPKWWTDMSWIRSELHRKGDN